MKTLYSSTLDIWKVWSQWDLYNICLLSATICGPHVHPDASCVLSACAPRLDFFPSIFRLIAARTLVILSDSRLFWHRFWISRCNPSLSSSSSTVLGFKTWHCHFTNLEEKLDVPLQNQTHLMSQTLLTDTIKPRGLDDSQYFKKQLIIYSSNIQYSFFNSASQRKYHRFLHSFLEKNNFTCL